MDEREKIVKVLVERFGIMPENCAALYSYQGIADALIAAGIGDVTEWKEQVECAERALFTACINLIKDEKDNVNMELLAHVVYTKFLRKAEKELEVGRKDD